ncbi:MAG TPA: hypothetical protein DIC34_04115 [Treponema sp.]|nr:MAG: hypothetical protein A2001_14135 [Treponema sp. GWC1_61_84]HCM25722.1 hypothetical protein [Treponema sp.]
MNRTKRFGLIACAVAVTFAAGAYAGGQGESKASGQKAKITLWSQFADPKSMDSGAIAFFKALENTRTRFPDVEIEHVGTGGEAYKQKIPVAGAANELPDMFFWWGGGTAEPFIKGNRVLALNDLASDGTLKRLVPGTTDNFVFGDKLYGLPIYISTAQLYVNKELFLNAGLKVPATWDELTTAIVALKAKGIIPIALGAKDRWPAMFWNAILDIRMGGVSAMNAALKKTGPFNTPEFVAAAKKFDELIKLGAFGDNYMGTSYDDSVNLFLTGKAAMIYMGAWVNGQIEADNSPVKGKVVPINVPAVPGGKGSSNDWHGGCGETFFMNANLKNKEQVWPVYKYFVETMAKEAFLAGSGSSAWLSESSDVAKMNILALQIGLLSAKATGFSYWWDQILTGNDTESMFGSLMQFIAGKSSPEQYAQELQTKISDRK